MSTAFVIQEKLAALAEQLLAVQPNIATLLRDIHRSLKADPDVVTILTEEECATLVKGLQKQTSTMIITAAVKKPAKAALSKVTLDDL
jgi:DNA polymerase III psi subunit